MRDFRLYMLIGGMPQSVEKYLKTNNLEQVDIQKREILELYADDFRKIDPTGRASRLFRSIPGQLSKNVSRYVISNVLPNSRLDRMEDLLQDMEDSQVVLFCNHSDDPNVGLQLHADRKRYKMFICDTGLFITLAFWDKDITENVIYQKLLTDKLSADLGYVYENMTAQILKASGHELFYHTWSEDGGKHFFETDFLISRGNKICPIEVKSSGYKSHTSLDMFCKKFSDRISNRYLFYTKDLRTEDKLTLTPMFMAGMV